MNVRIAVRCLGRSPPDLSALSPPPGADSCPFGSRSALHRFLALRTSGLFTQDGATCRFARTARHGAWDGGPPTPQRVLPGERSDASGFRRFSIRCSTRTPPSSQAQREPLDVSHAGHRTSSCSEQHLQDTVPVLRTPDQPVRASSPTTPADSSPRSPRCTALKTAKRLRCGFAVTAYVLVAVLRKLLELSADLYTISPVLSLTLFEKLPIFTFPSVFRSQLQFTESRKL